jgi:hypothetical protein
MYSSLSYIYHLSGNSVFQSEIAQKEKLLLRSSAKTSPGKDHTILLLQLAMLYSNKNNPNPDFNMAIKYLQQYSKFEDQVSVEYTQALLNDMFENKSKYDILETNYNQLVEEKKKLARSYSSLVFKMQSKNKTLQEQKRVIQGNEKKIKKKNEIIEKLKVLDIQLENRRADTE